MSKPPMTYDDFMIYAEQEIDFILRSKKNRIMNLVKLAWAEGKRHAETEAVVRIVNDAISVMTDFNPQEIDVSMNIDE